MFDFIFKCNVLLLQNMT